MRHFPRKLRCGDAEASAPYQPRNLLRLLCLAGLAGLTAAGCSKNDQIRSYSAPKDLPAPATGTQGVEPPAASGAQTGEPVPQASGGPESVEWTLPSGWRATPGEGMRFATILLESGSGNSPPLELRVTPLGFGARDPLANINRWREQIGLEAIGPQQLGQVAQEVDVDGRTGHMVSMVGPKSGANPPQQVLGAILPGNERVWFFLVMDRADRVGRYEKPFTEFVHSVRVVGGQMAAAGLPAGHPDTGGLPAGHPPIGPGGPGAPGTSGSGPMSGAPDMNAGIPAAPAGGPQLHWKTPPSWQEQPGNSAFRVATFAVAAAAGKAEVTITRFPGGVGGLLANINRWRGQLGLEPVNGVSQQPLESMVVDGQPAQLLDLVGPEGAGDAGRQRMLVVLLARDDLTWFVKMTGPNGFLDAQKRTFVDFARSIHFAQGAS
jgi:hypothetical protein